jgi:hypothetical protein
VHDDVVGGRRRVKLGVDSVEPVLHLAQERQGAEKGEVQERNEGQIAPAQDLHSKSAEGAEHTRG